MPGMKAGDVLGHETMGTVLEVGGRVLRVLITKGGALRPLQGGVSSGARESARTQAAAAVAALVLTLSAIKLSAPRGPAPCQNPALPPEPPGRRPPAHPPGRAGREDPPPRRPGGGVL